MNERLFEKEYLTYSCKYNCHIRYTAVNDNLFAG